MFGTGPGGQVDTDTERERDGEGSVFVWLRPGQDVVDVG